MIILGAKQIRFSAAAECRGRQTVRVSTDVSRPQALRSREAFVVGLTAPPSGFGWYIISAEATADALDATAAVVTLPADFDYLADGDVIRLAPDDHAVRVLYRRSSGTNSFLLTERCNNYCLMCSQPPRNVADGWIVDEILEALPLIDQNAKEIIFTGGEPTLLGDRFLELVRAMKSYLPRTSLHILSNGRNFADASLAAKLGAIAHPDIMLGIPVYSDLSHLHDYVVQADGAFDQTIQGILNLKRYGVPVEVRVVLHRHTVTRLPQLATFLTRNLLFVDHVALMGLEIMGFARANLDDLWIDPVDYQTELASAVGILDRARMRVSIYNSQLCLLDRTLWRFDRRSISDWKQEYMPECDGCEEKKSCAGFFASAKYRYSEHIRPFNYAVAAK